MDRNSRIAIRQIAAKQIFAKNNHEHKYNLYNNQEMQQSCYKETCRETFCITNKTKYRIRPRTVACILN